MHEWLAADSVPPNPRGDFVHPRRSLGSRVGKARLSLFNMRPRRTAVVITVLTGSLISALSLGLMLLVSRQLRVGLFELDTLQARLKDSREQLDTAERERIEARKATVRIEAELKAAQQRAQTLRQELAPLQEQRLALEADRDRLSRDIAARDLEIQKTEAELNSVRNRIQLGERELKDLERNLVALRRGAVVVRSGQVLATATVRMESPDQAKQVWIAYCKKPISTPTARSCQASHRINRSFVFPEAT